MKCARWTSFRGKVTSYGKSSTGIGKNKLDKVILSRVYCIYAYAHRLHEGYKMKKRMNLYIDEDIYNALEEMPRKVSVSEVVSWLFKILLSEAKKGRELTKEELDALVESTPEGRDFRERMIEHWGPGIKKLVGIPEQVNQSFTSKKSKEEKRVKNEPK